MSASLRASLKIGLAACLLVTTVLTSGCPDPNLVLSIDKFTMQFTRLEQVRVDDMGTPDDPSDDRELHEPPGEPIRKTLTISNSSDQDIFLDIYLQTDDPAAPHADAFTLLGAATQDDNGDWKFQVVANSRLQLPIQFDGQVVGTNLSRLIIESPEDDYRQTVVLQGEVDCVSLNLDLDKDGFCRAPDGTEPPITATEDCNDNPDTGYAINPAATEVCEAEGDDEVDNNCDGSAVDFSDGDGDGWCDLTATCGLSEADILQFCESAVIDDCDDEDPAINPGATEVCEPGAIDAQTDNNCSPLDDFSTMDLMVPDGDGDGVGVWDAASFRDRFESTLQNPSDADDGPFLVCALSPPGFSLCVPADLAAPNPFAEIELDDSNTILSPAAFPDDLCINDCADNDGAEFPGNPEICDGKDNDCDPSTTIDGGNDINEDLDDFALCHPLGDCDDLNDEIYPGAPEICDALDSDCDGDVPDDETDADGDTYAQCAADCDDNDPAVNPGAVEDSCDGVDNNCDGQKTPEESDDDLDGETECGDDGVLGTADDDCNDSAPTVYADAPELCDGLDNDCNAALVAAALGGVLGDIDNDGIADFADNDLDNDGVLNLDDEDIDDDGLLNDDPLELDDDGNGIPDDEQDRDGDGYVECEVLDLNDPGTPEGYLGVVGAAGGSDCNDDPSDPVAANVYPGAPEISDSYYDSNGDFRLVDNQCPGDPGYDDDCDPSTGIGCSGGEFCFDSVVSASSACNDPASLCFSCSGSEFDSDFDGVTEAQGDCDNSDAARSPENPEICDGVDNDCNGTLMLAEQDLDGDGYVLCEPPLGITTVLGGDCDDTNGDVNPGEVEVADGNGLDDDCDGVVHEEESDLDGDGHTVIGGDCDDNDPLIHPGAEEICDEIDNDCDPATHFDGADIGLPELGNELDEDGDGFTACGDGDCLDSGAQLDAELSDYVDGVPGYSGLNGDAVAAAIHPGATEVCDGWANDCGSTTGEPHPVHGYALLYLPSDTEYEDERDNDLDGFVECTGDDFSGWNLGNNPSANLDLNGGHDCADVINEPVGVPADPLDQIFPNATDLCDGWNNDCSFATPFVVPNTAEWDDDGDQYIECAPFVDLGQLNDDSEPILGGNDCLDDPTLPHFATGASVADLQSVAPNVHPGAVEVCDGLNNNCSGVTNATAPQAYDADDENEDDDDNDLHLECTNPVAWIVTLGYASHDCLDEWGPSADPHFQTGEEFTEAQAAGVNPSATEVCDGFNNDCSAPLATTAAYDANENNSTFDESDDDLDRWIACLSPDATLVPGFEGGGDCLDRSETHGQTGEVMELSTAAVVNPGMLEICDGLNTDCSLPYVSATEPWRAEAQSENDQDGDLYVECTTPSSYIVDVGYQVGDCLDEDVVHPDTGVQMGLVVSANVNPGQDELCDGVDTNCDGGGSPLFIQDELDETDADGDGYIECDDPESWTASVGYLLGDCLDEFGASADPHFETNEDFTQAAAAAVNPGASEVCDGLDNDCSSPTTPVYDAEAGDENDTDGDGFLECASVPGYSVAIGFGAEDCLDEIQVHGDTGDDIPLSIAAQVNPDADEVCDGLNTDCSPFVPVPSVAFAPEDPNEEDFDGDLHIECEDDPAAATLVDNLLTGDCDDTDVDINPAETDDFSQNLVDNDCDGTQDEEAIEVGFITVNEIAASPVTGAFGRWFEVRNNSANDIELQSWLLTDGDGNPLEVTDSIVVSAGGLAVLCRLPSSAGGIGCDNGTGWGSSFDIGLDGGGLTLTVPNQASGSLDVDTVTWLDDLGSAGVAAGFDPEETGSPAALAAANDSTDDTDGNPITYGAWCDGLRADASGTFGTPGSTNPSCDAFSRDEDGDGFCERGKDLNSDGDCDDSGEGQDDPTALSQCAADVCDCDDTNEFVAPLLAEICDGWDTDCSENADDPSPEVPEEVDHDGDLYIECTAVPSRLDPTLISGDDCNDDPLDGDAVTTFPNVPSQNPNEVCDSVDSDCDGSIVDGDPDRDGDLTPDCVDPDDDGDGLADGVDECDPDSTGVGTGDIGWTSNGTTDRDGDGCQDAGEDTDDDGDSLGDGPDQCDPDTLGAGQGEVGWTSDQATTDHDEDGCRDATGEDNDDDNDGLADGPDDCDPDDSVDSEVNWDSSNNGLDHDDDGCKDDTAEDTDDDNDNRADGSDQCDPDSGNPNSEVDWDSTSLSQDHDSDGCRDSTGEDNDDDNDGIADGVDDCADGELFTSNATTDHDTDGCQDTAAEDTDDDNDGRLDGPDQCDPDTTGVGTGNLGWDSTDNAQDYDDDGCQDSSLEDLDDDNDGVADTGDTCDTGNFFTSSNSTDRDGDGCEDASSEDTDDDGDSLADGPDQCDPDTLGAGQGDIGWTSNGATDFDGDGCQDSGEDDNDDNDPSLDSVDCNDFDASIYVGATEACDLIDSDCDGSIVDEDTDTDGDGTPDCVDDDADNDGFAPGDGDCNDTDDTIFPGAVEGLNDGVDQNCDGEELCYEDADNDNFVDNGSDQATSTDGNLACTGAGVHNATTTADCDDAVFSTNPGAPELVNDGVDANCDGQELCYDDSDEDNYVEGGNDTFTTADGDLSCTGANAHNATTAADCNDGNAAINPGATEIPADGVDQNCDTDELCYDDSDGDDYVEGGSNTVNSNNLVCNNAGEHDAITAADCNDAVASINPGEAEVLNDNTDQNCDGQELCYLDDDEDDYVVGGSTTFTTTDGDLSCTGTDAHNATTTADCNDSNPAINPGAAETLNNGVDTNCDGQELCYLDDDEDDYVVGGSTTFTTTDGDLSCTGLDAHNATTAADCNDGDAGINPGAAETLNNGIDTNCDGEELCYDDSDGDDYVEGGSNQITTTDGDLSCNGAGAHNDTTAADCNDTDPDIHPDQTEVVDDTVDDDCDGFFDVSCYVDADGDGFGLMVASPAVQEVAPATAECSTGFARTEGDCNDLVAGVNPGTDLPTSQSDGTLVDACSTHDGDDYCIGGGEDGNADNDCQDEGENYQAVVVGDCDEATTATGTSEDWFDGLDGDGDTLIDEGCFGASEVVVTEYFLTDATIPDWIEVTNVTWHEVNLSGWALQDTTGAAAADQCHVLGATATDIAPGDSVVIANALPVHASITPYLTWTGTTNCTGGSDSAFALEGVPAGTDVVALRLGEDGTTVDSAAFVAAIPDPAAGQSVSLNPTELAGALANTASAPDNDTPGNWCLSADGPLAWSGGTGTPAELNVCQ